MSEDTAVNRAIQQGSKWLGANWRQWAPLMGGAALSILGLAIAYGSKQEHHASMEMSYQTDRKEDKEWRERIEAKLDALAPIPSQVKGLDERISRMEGNWDFATQQAGVNPRPGHRAKH